MDIGSKKSNNDISGVFELEVMKDGLYLNVSSANDDINITLNAINSLLLDMGGENIDSNQIKQAIASAGTSLRVASLGKPPFAEIYVSKDEMEVTACVKGNQALGNFSREQLVAEINRAGIVAGLDEEAVSKVVSKPGETFVIARGILPVDGANAEIELRQKVSQEKGRPVETEGGRVDYKNLNLFSAVLENDVIAEKIPATQGVDGTTVRGKKLKSKDGRDKRIQLGKNVKLEENKFISKIAGHLVIGKDKFEVLPVLDINSDVDLSTGNIEFPGNVIVKGNVQSGFIVKAQGNVQINGSVFGGTVEGKQIEVKHGIQGGNLSYVKAEESLTAKFIENADVFAGEDIIISDAILHSKVSAGKRVLASGSKGIIAGGHVSAGEEIDAKTIGTQMSPPTILEVGVNPMLKEEYLMLRADYKDAMAKLEGTKKSLQIIKPTETSIVPPERMEIYMKLTKSNFALLGIIESMKERLTFIEGEFDKLGRGKVKCGGIIYPGVKLVINNIVYPVRDTLQYSTFYVSDGEVRFTTYD